MSVENATLVPEVADELALEHPDGVYFNLSNEEYHRDKALGSTNIRKLLTHPGDYWWDSWMNVEMRKYDAAKDPTAAQVWGTAFHTLICEGRDKFEARYYRGPAKEDYPNLMVTMDHMKVWLQQRGLAVSGNKDALIQRVLNTDPKAPVWAEIERKAEVLAQDRIVLKPDVYDSVSISALMILKNPHCGRAFENGYPEVSVFWTDESGVRLKARFDYLRLRAIIDLKSFRNFLEREFTEAILFAIKKHKYIIQAVHYLNARDQIPRLVKEGKVFGEVSKAWLDTLVKEIAKGNNGYCWIFYQAENAPLAARFDMRRHNQSEMVARTDVRTAIDNYRQYLEVYGTDIWPNSGEPYIVDDEDLLGRYA